MSGINYQLELLGESSNFGTIHAIEDVYDKYGILLGVRFVVQPSLVSWWNKVTLPLSRGAFDENPHYPEHLVLWRTMSDRKYTTCSMEGDNLKIYVNSDRYGSIPDALAEIDILKANNAETQLRLDISSLNNKKLLNTLKDRELDSWDMDERVVAHIKKISGAGRIGIGGMGYGFESEFGSRDPITGKFLTKHQKEKLLKASREFTEYPTPANLLASELARQSDYRPSLMQPTIIEGEYTEGSPVQSTGGGEVKEERKTRFGTLISKLKRK